MQFRPAGIVEFSSERHFGNFFFCRMGRQLVIVFPELDYNLLFKIRIFIINLKWTGRGRRGQRFVGIRDLLTEFFVPAHTATNDHHAPEVVFGGSEIISLLRLKLIQKLFLTLNLI